MVVDFSYSQCINIGEGTCLDREKLRIMSEKKKGQNPAKQKKIETKFNEKDFGSWESVSREGDSSWSGDSFGDEAIGFTSGDAIHSDGAGPCGLVFFRFKVGKRRWLAGSHQNNDFELSDHTNEFQVLLSYHMSYCTM